jgi:hypothetical protein
MQPKVAFYPCCAMDISEPLLLLSSYVDKVLYCDIKVSLLPRWKKLLHNESDKLKSVFLIGDVRQVISQFNQIDVLFYRGDSQGEGGSGVFILGDSVLPKILEKFPVECGLIITDGSNSRGSNFDRMIRSGGLIKHGWEFRKNQNQPFLEKYGLYIIDVKCNRPHSNL